MSLSVSPELLSLTKNGGLSEEDFYQCVKQSLPFAVDIIHRLVHEAGSNGRHMAEFTPRTLEPERRGELLRATASTAIRSALEHKFSDHQKVARGITIAFKNCHAVAVFLRTRKGRAALRKWSSAEEQILAQSPELVDC